MRSAQAVDVVVAEDDDIAFVVLAGDGVPALGVELVAVDAADLELLAVEKYHGLVLFRLTHDLYLAETEVERPEIEEIPRRVDEHYVDLVKIGIFRAPKPRRGDLAVQAQHRALPLAGGGELERTRGDLFPFGVRESDERLAARGKRARGVYLHARLEHRAGEVVPVELRPRVDIGYAHARHEDEHHIAEDAGQSPHVLILEIAARREAVDDDLDLVLARPHELRDVVLLIVEGGLGVAHELAVDIHLGAAVGGELHMHSALKLLLGELERAHIHAAGVVRVVDGGELERICADGIGIAHIGVDGLVVTLELPVRRHLDAVPLGGILVQQCHGRIELEIPLPAETASLRLPVLGERIAGAVLGQRAYAVNIGVGMVTEVKILLHDFLLLVSDMTRGVSWSRG